MASVLLLSAYEVARERLIKDNQAVLESLGLARAPPGAAAAVAAGRGASAKTGRSGAKKKSSKPGAGSRGGGARAKRKAPPAVGTRRSSRLQGVKADNVELRNGPELGDESFDSADDDGGKLNNLRVQRKIAMLKALHAQKGTAYKNPTATYEHTWMRVRTMSEKRLSTRVKVIERALGQHCIVKLRMFAEVLILSGMDDLAAEATAALDRVLAAVHGSSSKSDKVKQLQQQATDAAVAVIPAAQGAEGVGVPPTLRSHGDVAGDAAGAAAGDAPGDAAGDASAAGSCVKRARMKQAK